MSLSLTIVKTGGSSYRFSWDGAPPYRMYLDGVEIFANDGVVPTENTDIELHSSDALEAPELEVTDAAQRTLADNLQHSPTGILQWRGNLQLESYRIDEFVASVWTERKIISETGQGYYKHITTELTDITAANWRVVGQDSEGGETQPLDFTFFPVRNPPAPSVTMSYSKPNLIFTAR